jgi:hypothetical protein
MTRSTDQRPRGALPFGVDGNEVAVVLEAIVRQAGSAFRRRRLRTVIVPLTSTPRAERRCALERPEATALLRRRPADKRGVSEVPAAVGTGSARRLYLARRNACTS